MPARVTCSGVLITAVMTAPPTIVCLTTVMSSLRVKLSRITACQPEGLEACLEACSNLVEAVFGSRVTQEILSELYDTCIDFLNSSNLNQAVTSAAAALVFLGSSQPSELVLRQFTQSVFLQLAAAAEDSPINNQVLQRLVALLASCQAWSIAYEILLCAHDSLAAPPTSQADHSNSRSSISTATHRQQQHEASRQVSVRLPVPTASNAIRELVAAAVRASTIAQQQDQAPEPAVQQILHHCTGPLFTSSCELLASPEPALRKAAFQQLHPALLQAAEAVSSSCRQQCMQQLWQQCLTMIAAPVFPKRMGLAVLLQYCSEWSIQPPSPTAAAIAEATQAAAAEAAAAQPAGDSSEQFWALLRACLVDSEALNRKRAFRIMQLLLPDDTLQQQPVWGVFTALYDLLDEFSPHLVKASWPLISQLHPVAPEYASADAESDVAISNQINLLSVTSKAQHQQRQEQGQAVGDGLPLSFCWSQVLWTRALQHKNLQVQRMALKTLLKRSWSPAVLCQVPPGFITAVLLPALLSPVHHKVPAAAGLTATGGVATAGHLSTTTPPPQPPAAAAAGGTSSQHQAPAVTSAHPVAHCSSGSSSAGFSVMKQGTDLLARYAAAVPPAVARDVLSGGLSMLASPGVDMPRSGLLVVLRALAAAAAASRQLGSPLQDLSAAEAAAYSESCLNKLQALLARLATYAGQTFRVNCYDMLLTIAAAVAPLGPCSVAAAARLLQSMPSWMQSPGGPLNHTIRAWLLGSSSSREVLREGVTNIFQQYFSSSDHHQQDWHADPTDYTSWRCMSDCWIRIVVSCDVDLQQQLAAAASDLSNRVDHLISRSYLAPGAAEKALGMMAQLFETAESAGGVAREAGQQLTVSTRIAVRLAEAVAEPLGATLVAYCQCYRCKPADMAGSSSSSSDGNNADGGRSLVRAGLSASAFAAVARAEVAAQAATAGAVVLARWISDQWGSGSSNSSSMDTTPSAAQQHAVPALLQLLTQLAHVGSQLSAEPLPSAVLSTPPGAAMQQSFADLSVTAAAEQSRASALKVLRHAALGITRSLLLLPDISLHDITDSTQCPPVQWINAVIRETAAAHALQSQWQQAAAAGEVGGRRDLLSSLTGDMDWKCLDAVMMLTAVTSRSNSRDGSHTNGLFSDSTAADVSSIKQNAPAANIPAAAGSYSSIRATYTDIQINDPSCPFMLPGVLSDDVVCVLFHHCLSALQWVSSDHGSGLVQLLRCSRRVWGAIVEDQQLQVSVHQSLAAAGLLFSPDSSSSSTPLGHLAAVLANGLLDLLRTSKKRPQIMYSLIINTLLIPQLLCPAKPQTATSVIKRNTHLTQEDLAVLHESTNAPLRRFIQGLLAQGCKGSPRLMLALGLQLGAAVSVNPQVAVWYCDELRQIVMFGGATQGAGGEEMTLGLASVEDTLERQLLSEPVDRELQAAYTLTDIGPRVAVCCGLYQLAEQAGLVQHSDPDNNDNSISRDVDYQWVAAVEAAGVVLWQNWLQSLLHDPVLAGEHFKVGSDIHRLKVRAWQGLTTLANFNSSHRQRVVAAAAVRDLLIQLTTNNPPSIKQYQEAIIAHLLLQHQGLMEELLLPQFASVEKGNTATGSHILIAVQVALHSPPECQARVLPVLVKQLLPWTNHHTHNIRTFAQLGFCAIMDTKSLDEWTGWHEGLGAGGIEVLRELLRFMHDNTDFQRFRKAMGTGMLSWSPVDVTSPRRIFSSTLHLAGAEETPVTFEGVPETLMDRLIVFLTAERAKLREAAVGRVAGYEGAAAQQWPAGTTFLGHQADENAARDERRGTGPAAVVLTSVGGSKGDFQRKVSHHERAALLADVLDELEAAGGVAGPAGTQRHDLIVVASLISKVPNLGGLARTAEVLGAGALVIGDKRLATEAAFTSVSVTAERWVPLIEVGEAVLIPWLAKKQAEGYSLVGLEQTAESTCLPSYKFSTKTVLVLGREIEGIPPEIIAMLDETVEIPQLGVIRSLNVHVSGAIAMYEYAKQQLPAGCRS